MDSFEKQLEEILINELEAWSPQFGAWGSNPRPQIAKGLAQQIKQLIAQAPLIQDEPESVDLEAGGEDGYEWTTEPIIGASGRNQLRHELKRYFGLEDK